MTRFWPPGPTLDRSAHWGLGLLANGGGTMNLDPTVPEGLPERKALDYFFDDDFGDNHFGATADRVLFVTKPLTIAKTIAKKADTDSNLVVGYGYTKLSEAPILPNEGFERQARPFGQTAFVSRGDSDDDGTEVPITGVCRGGVAPK